MHLRACLVGFLHARSHGIFLGLLYKVLLDALPVLQSLTDAYKAPFLPDPGPPLQASPPNEVKPSLHIIVDGYPAIACVDLSQTRDGFRKQC